MCNNAAAKNQPYRQGSSSAHASNDKVGRLDSSVVVNNKPKQATDTYSQRKSKETNAACNDGVTFFPTGNIAVASIGEIHQRRSHESGLRRKATSIDARYVFKKRQLTKTKEKAIETQCSELTAINKALLEEQSRLLWLIAGAKEALQENLNESESESASSSMVLRSTNTSPSKREQQLVLNTACQQLIHDRKRRKHNINYSRLYNEWRQIHADEEESLSIRDGGNFTTMGMANASILVLMQERSNRKHSVSMDAVRLRKRQKLGA